MKQSEFYNIKPLIHGQINLIEFIESGKFDNAHSKISNFFCLIKSVHGTIIRTYFKLNRP